MTKSGLVLASSLDESYATCDLMEVLLVRTEHPIELRALDGSGKVQDRVWLRSLSEIFAFQTKYNGKCHVLFGAATHDKAGGKLQHCREVPWLWVDMDFKDFANGETEAREQLKSYQYPPTIVVSTGGGLHCYWVLQETLDAQMHQKEIGSALKSLVSTLGGDMSRTDITSMLRLPGTINIKPERNAAVCHIEHVDLKNSITLDKVLDSIPVPEQPISKPSLQELADDIKVGNRDTGALQYINAVVKQHGTATDDEGLAADVTDLLKKAGGDDLETIIKKVPTWITTAHAFFDVHNKRSPLELADELIENAQGHIKYVGGQFRIYQEGHWPPVDENACIRQKIATLDRPHTSATRTSNALQTLKDLTAISDISPNRTLVCLGNGTLEPESGKLLPHSPDHNLLNVLPITWDPAATCPLWLHTLDEMFKGDTDSKDKIMLLQLWFGYCLVPDTSQHKFLWLAGTGANGKSVVLEILSAVVGQENVSHAMLTRLDRAFVRMTLHGRLVNISSEMKAEDTVSDGYLKAIVAGDCIEAEEKYKPSVSFRPYARIVAATNELPRLLDLSEGFRRRAIILEFNRTFNEDEQDKHRTKKLLGELPGILLWAVSGLKKLRELGCLPIPPSSTSAIQNYIKDSDPIRQFVEEMLMEVEDGCLTTTPIYLRYRDWASDRGYQKMNVVTFGKRMKKLGMKRRHTNGKEVWCAKFSKLWDTSKQQ